MAAGRLRGAGVPAAGLPAAGVLDSGVLGVNDLVHRHGLSKVARGLALPARAVAGGGNLAPGVAGGQTTPQRLARWRVDGVQGMVMPANHVAEVFIVIALRFLRRLLHGYLFWPLMLVVLGVLLAMLTAYLDAQLSRSGGLLETLSVLRMDEEGARAVLSTVAAAAVTILSLVYSMTLVVFTLAASALGNRIIRTFGDNRLGQITAGVLAGTFVFALVSLYLAPGERAPLLSAAGAVVLAIVAVILLIAFVNNVAHRIQIDNELARIQRMLTGAVERMVRDLHAEAGEANDVAAVPTHDVSRPWQAARTGYVTALQLKGLVALMREHEALMIMHVATGDFVLDGETLATVHMPEGDTGALDSLASMPGRFIAIEDARAPQGDILFSVHLIVEIALRALSPGTNDSYTAVAAIDQMSASLVTLMRAPGISGRLRDESGTVRVAADLLSIKQVLGAALHPIRRAAASNVLVMIALAKALKRLAHHSGATHGALLRKHIYLLVMEARRCIDEAADRDELAALLMEARQETKRLPG
jgi:uncharacterized membrane protein